MPDDKFDVYTPLLHITGLALINLDKVLRVLDELPQAAGRLWSFNAIYPREQWARIYPPEMVALGHPIAGTAVGERIE